MKTLNELLPQGEEILKQNQIANAKMDAWLLMEHVFQITRSEFYLKREQKQPDCLSDKYLNLVYLRSTHKPVQHIIGTQEFMGLEFIVDENVLIPRQDTELLVEKAIEFVKNLDSENVKILDMCTGSGCIAVSLAKFLGVKKIVGADISKKALAIARKNAYKNKVKCEFIESDLFQNIHEEFSIIVSNPPYIRTNEINELMAEVKDYEPVSALDGGKAGLDFYRSIAREAKKHFEKQGFLLFEIGYDEAEFVRNILTGNGYTDISLFKDLAGLDRVITAKIWRL